jgi:hypothetical protein
MYSKNQWCPMTPPIFAAGNKERPRALVHEGLYVR